MTTGHSIDEGVLFIVLFNMRMTEKDIEMRSIQKQTAWVNIWIVSFICLV